jgi:DNA-binding transcriptional ArsR family regulator
VLLNLKTGRVANQRELAEAVGLREATLTHHLNAMEKAGLVTRRRDEINRRIHVVSSPRPGIRRSWPCVTRRWRLTGGCAAVSRRRI